MKRSLELDAALQGMEEGNLVGRSMMETPALVVEANDSRLGRTLLFYAEPRILLDDINDGISEFQDWASEKCYQSSFPSVVRLEISCLPITGTSDASRNLGRLSVQTSATFHFYSPLH
jgi:hypothetical protein